jgi:hypothetical protein
MSTPDIDRELQLHLRKQALRLERETRSGQPEERHSEVLKHFLTTATSPLETPRDIERLIAISTMLSAEQRERAMVYLIKYGASEEDTRDDDAAFFIISLLHAHDFPLPDKAVLIAYDSAFDGKWMCTERTQTMVEFLLDLGADGLDEAIDKARWCEFTKPWHLNYLLRTKKEWADREGGEAALHNRDIDRMPFFHRFK